jgi:hypothetical protein
VAVVLGLLAIVVVSRQPQPLAGARVGAASGQASR